ncbi:MAG: SDR family oxidoreductase [Planctomycetota bacterium]
MAKRKLEGRRALVTGSSSGIGAALARELARHGAHLVLVARREERLQALAEELRAAHGVEVAVHAADLLDAEARAGLFAATEGAGVAIDVLVNNAGLGSYEAFLDSSWEALERILELNVRALTHLTRLFVPAMVARGRGNVMNIASTGAYMSCPDFAVYTASKVYVRNLTEALDFELKGTGVRALAICPGGTYTEFLDHAGQTLKAGSSLAMMSAERCARISVKKMLRGRRTVIVGWLNVLSMFWMRFLPRCAIPWVANFLMRSGVEKSAPRLPTAKA